MMISLPGILSQGGLAGKGKPLDDFTWEQIRQISDAGLAAEYWSVGETKSIVINGTVSGMTFTNLAIDAVIIGINHNAALEGANRIHFAIGKINGKNVGLCDSKFGTAAATGFSMKATPSSSGGWAESRMRKTVLGNSGTPDSPPANSLLAALPSDLLAAMKSVKKYTDNAGNGATSASAVTATTDYLFIPSELEFNGAASLSNQGEPKKQIQYEYFLNTKDQGVYKHNNVANVASWWLRSAYAHSNYKSHYLFVSHNASVNHTYSISYDSATMSKAIRPCFCV